MKATLALEYIGEGNERRLKDFERLIDGLAPGLGGVVVGEGFTRRPWVTEIVGREDSAKLVRRSLLANWQRKDANSKQTRGVYLWFILESGRLYEVRACQSWRSTRRYFCTVSEDGAIYELTPEQAAEWVNEAWPLTY